MMTFMTFKHREAVAEFHRLFGHPCPVEGDVTGLVQDKKLRELRIKLVTEELYDELMPALTGEDVVETADAIGDALYVLYGASIAFGLANIIVFPDNRPLRQDTELALDQFNAETASEVYALLEPDVSRFTDVIRTCAVNPNLIYEAQDCIDTLITQLYYLGYNKLGLPVDAIFNEIHTSNMSKLGEDGKPIYREDGKILKGPNFRLPALEPIIFKLTVGETI